MKKMWTTILIIGLVILGTTGIVGAQNSQSNGQYQSVHQLKQEQKNSGNAIPVLGDIDDVDSSLYSDSSVAFVPQQPTMEQTGNSTKKNDIQKIKFQGVWGYDSDNQTQGCIRGFIGKRNHNGILKGLWNTTENSVHGKITGILRKGFFNGRYTLENGTSFRITGLYRIDKENKTLKIRWITAKTTGWALLKLVIP